MAINPYKLVDVFKEDMYDEVSGMSDYDIFEYAKNRFPSEKSRFEGIDNPFPKQQMPSPPSTKGIEYDEEKHSPGAWESLTGVFNLADSFAEEGKGINSLGISPEFFISTYNQSMAGMLYAIKNGKFKYDVDEYEPSIMAEVGQFAVGLLNPIDLVTFIGAPAAGSIVGRKLAQAQMKKWATNA